MKKVNSTSIVSQVVTITVLLDIKTTRSYNLLKETKNSKHSIV